MLTCSVVRPEERLKRPSCVTVVWASGSASDGLSLCALSLWLLRRLLGRLRDGRLIFIASCCRRGKVLRRLLRHLLRRARLRLLARARRLLAWLLVGVGASGPVRFLPFGLLDTGGYALICAVGGMRKSCADYPPLKAVARWREEDVSGSRCQAAN